MMLESLRSLFQTRPDSAAAEGDAEKRLELASAALLFEVLKADHDMDEREFASIAKVLRATTSKDSREIEELLELARQESSAATSLYEFTSLINEHFDYGRKCALIRHMWRIAYADSELSKYEDYVIRKVCELIYVSHSDFIRTKLWERDGSKSKIAE